MNSKTAISILVALIIIAGIFVPVVSASTQEHIVIEKINSGATDGVDLEYYTPQEGKTSVEVYPDTVTITADNGTVTITYPSTTKTITGDAILAIGGGSAPSAKDLNLYVKNSKIYSSGVEYSSCTIKCVDNINLGSLYIDLVLTGTKTTSLMPLVDWAYLPTLGGAYGSYTGGLAYELSDVVSVGDFAGVYIAAKGTDIISNNEYDLGATIERDTGGNIAGVKYAKATAEAAAVDGSASAYTGEDPVIIAPDEGDGTVAVLTPEEWDGEDAAASTTTPTGTLVGDCYYTTSGTSATVTGPADGSATSIIIPEEVVINSTSYSVTSIKQSAFKNCASLASITLPSGLTTLGDGAFEYCTSLTSITLPSGLTKIPSDTFGYCTSLTSITLPSGLTSIGMRIFYNCSSLASITLPSGITEISTGMFYNCSSLASITLPSGITEISPSAFQGCTALTSITLPSGLTSVGSRAFYGTPITALIIVSSPQIATDALPSTLTEVLNFGSTTLTTAMGITDNTVVSDSIHSLAIVQQKQYINSYYEPKDGAVYDLIGMIPIIVLAGLAIAIVGVYAARRD